jgi:alpha-glucosidase
MVLSNGVEVVSNGLHEKVVALRDDVVRIRVWRGNTPPEDASWAVLTSSRSSSVPVNVQNSGRTCGFRTDKLIIQTDKASLALSIQDPSGTILLEDARPIRFDSDAFRIYKTMPLDEHYFGLGDKVGPLDRRNQAFSLWNTDAYRFQESTDPIYKSIPYFMTYRAGRASGILLDNTWRSSFDFGKEVPDSYSFGAAGGPIDYYFFFGPTPKQVVETYAWLTGTPPLPPLWSFGYQQSRYSYMTQARVLEVAGQLRAENIPADAIYLDIDFQEKNRPFTVDKAAFPDLAGMVEKLKTDHFHVVAITDLHIAKVSGQSYLPYETGVTGGHFVKNPDGTIYAGRVWPGPSVFPDFTRQQTRAWWGSLYAGLRKDGIEGFWNDMNEPSIFDSPTLTMPDSTMHRIDESGFMPRTATHAEIHNVYGMENARATYDGLLALDPGMRPFVLSRAAYAGAQRYAVTWTGDNSSSWNHLRMTTPMLENLGLSGFAFAGADVGGYAGTPTPELLTKWFEIGAFQPIDRDHTEKGTGDQEPWVGGRLHEDIRRHFIEERYRLLPYLYTLADESSRTGLPMLRPLFFEFPDAFPDHHPIDVDLPASGEFMLGPDLLIAPSHYLDETDSYVVELPSDGWYDFWSGARVIPASPATSETSGAASDVKAPTTLQISPRLDELPVFVRAGSILPLAPLVENTAETPRGPLTLQIYVGDHCGGSLYQDDGTSFAYKNGSFLRLEFTCESSTDGLRIHVSSPTGTFSPWWNQVRLEVFGVKPPRGEILSKGNKLSAHIDRNPNSVSFVIPYEGKEIDLLLR